MCEYIYPHKYVNTNDFAVPPSFKHSKKSRPRKGLIKCNSANSRQIIATDLHKVLETDSFCLVNSIVQR